MRSRALLTAVLTIGACLAQTPPALAQTAGISDAQCQSLRERLTEHARLSEGVRRAVAAQAGPAPSPTVAATPTTPPPPVSTPTGRGDAIRARLEQIPKERQTLEDQRLASMVRFDFGRANQIQGQIQAIDAERASLERELAALPVAPAATAAPAAPIAAAPQPPPSDVTRIRCQDLPATLDSAMKIRRRELGAREDQAGAIPLMGLKGQTADQVRQELVGQFASGPAGRTQLGLLDANGDGRLDGFVDTPVAGVLRLVRQRPDGTFSVEAFAIPGSGAPAAYGDVTRRLDETVVRQSGQPLNDLVATRPAGPSRAVTQTAEFEQAYAQFQAGSFAEAARLSAPAARSMEFQNLRGESLRVLEIIGPLTGGVSMRRAAVLVLPDDQELWEETTTIVRPTASRQLDVEVLRSRQTRSTMSGAVVGGAPVSTSSKFSIDR